MPKLLFKEIKDKTIPELMKYRTENKKNLQNHRFKNNLKALKQTHEIKILKKNIAIINTTLSFKLKEKNGNNLK